MAKFGDVFKGTDVKKTDNRPRSETRWLHYTKLIDNTDQYRKSATEEDIVAFAELIKSAGKVLQDLLVRKSGTDTYEIIAGHHRRLACKYLVEVEGLKEFEFLPCKVENVDDVQAEFQLYATNGFMPKTDAEKLHESSFSTCSRMSHNQRPTHGSSELSTSVTPHPNDAGLLSLCPPNGF